MSKKKKSKRKVKIVLEVDYDHFFNQLAREQSIHNSNGFKAKVKIKRNKKKYSRKDKKRF